MFCQVSLEMKKAQCRQNGVGGGFRGGNWNNASTNARPSDRNNAANTNSNRNNNNGFRLAKTSRLCFFREIGAEGNHSATRWIVKLKDLYEKIISKENLYRSARRAALGKRYRDSTADFNFHLEKDVEILRRELADGTYRHGAYRSFMIHEPKKRMISAAPFRDRVVHHAAHDIIEPLIDKTFIHDSYACRQGKGTHKAVDRAQSFLRANRFCLHGDIRKYFPSIDHGILKAMFAKRIVDKKLLWLLTEIVDSAPNLGAYVGRPKGLPIGNLTSQFFANLYLNELDYFVKFELRLRYYLRHMDDFLIFSSDKTCLIEIRNRIRDFLGSELKLELHKSKSQIYETAKGVKFLGFRLYENYRRLAADNVRRFRERLRGFVDSFRKGSIAAVKICDSVRCWTAHSRYADTVRLRRGIFSGLEHDRAGALLKDILLS